MENFFHKITQAWAVYGSMKHSLQETSFSIHDGDTISLPLEINTKLHFFLPLVFRLTGHLWTCAWCSSPAHPPPRKKKRNKKVKEKMLIIQIKFKSVHYTAHSIKNLRKYSSKISNYNLIQQRNQAYH